MPSIDLQDYHHSSGSNSPAVPRHVLSKISYLYTNIPPNDDEAKHFAQILSSAKDREKWLGSEIRFLELTLMQRRAELEVVRQVVREHAVVLSPARRLPTELLVEIFSHVQGSEESEDALEISRGLWPSSQVCGSWRAVILDHKRFWTTVNVPWRMYYPSSAANILSLFLDRSGSKPLTVNFSCRDSENRFYREHTQTLFGVLITQFGRWQTCRLNIPVGALNLFAKASINPSIIRHLELNLQPPPYLDTLLLHTLGPFYDMLAGAKELHSLKFTGLKNLPAGGLRNLRFPWSQLTRYDAHQEYPEFHIVTLRLATNLVECTLSSPRPWGHLPVLNTETVHLPTLRLLNLDGTTNVLLQFLTAPNLRSLSVSTSTGTIAGDLLESFLGRSQCFLRELKLDLGTSSDDMVSVLLLNHYVSNLVKLALKMTVPRNSTALRDLVVALKYAPDDEGACKLVRLQELDFSVYQSSEKDLHATELAEMVLSRWNLSAQLVTSHKTFARLKSFKLETNSYWLPVFDQLKELNQEGMKTVIVVR